VNDDIALNLDFAETFLDYAGVPAPADMQGRSLRPLLQGRTPPDWRTSMYYHYYEYPAVHSVKRHYGVRTQRYKLIHFYHDIDEWELYDLKNDPDEMHNIYSDPQYADVVKELKAELGRLRTQYHDTTGAPI
jgi:arylsulfatase A-like enzyme